MTYNEAIDTLRDNHFYPGTYKKEGEAIGLHLDCSTIFQKEVKLPRVKELLEKEGFKVDFFPNEQLIKITKK